MKKAIIVTRLVSVLSVATAACGLAYSAYVVPWLLINREYDPDTSYWLPFFLAMSSVCIGVYLVLLVTGIQLLRGNLISVQRFRRVMFFEIGYFIAATMLCMVPLIGQSVAAAYGVANGGLAFQAVILFPLWAPSAVGWAKRELQDEPEHLGARLE